MEQPYIFDGIIYSESIIKPNKNIKRNTRPLSPINTIIKPIYKKPKIELTCNNLNNSNICHILKKIKIN